VTEGHRTAAHPCGSWVGVDVGGTFTDVITYDATKATVSVGKRLTDPAHPARGVVTAVEQVVDGAGAEMHSLARFAHGTTVGLNALLQRRGAVVGMLCTEGFRDVLEIRRGTREDAFDLSWQPPAPLVPRRLRLAVHERMRADGSSLEPLRSADVEAAVPLFVAAGVDSIAVAFINAWANPDHERLAGALLREAGFAGEITLSHELSREYREFERTSTTVVNAYIRPHVAAYLRELGTLLRAHAGDVPLEVMRSGGGTMSFEDAERAPFEAIFSGPVAGADATARLALELGLEMAIAADVGGTSFDTCLILNGALPLLAEGSVGGMPVQSSWVDVRSIGAGGGSIARVDHGGLLRVGPESAGSEPGPAAYGRGGLEPTTTDAAVALGMLGDGLLADRVALDHASAVAALEPLAATLGLDVTATARGVLTVASAAMADAIREITVEHGHDPRVGTLVAFGGAGPLFATLLADELELDRIVVPPLAGNFSAWGLLGAPRRRTAARTLTGPLDPATLGAAGAIARELLEGLGHLEADEVRVGLDIRYRGQDRSLTVALPDGSSLADPEVAGAFDAAFRRDFQATYLHEFGGVLELIAVRVTIARPAPSPRPVAPPSQADSRERPHARAYSHTRAAWLEFARVDRAVLAVEEVVLGPAIVHEQTSTTYLDAGFVARVHAGGSLLIEREEHP
jgi:N-methylhydantoinase A